MSIPYSIRPFAPDDYETVVTLGQMVFGEDMSMDAETLRRIDAARATESPWGRPVAVGQKDGQIHGFLHWGQVPGTPSFSFWIAVHPEQRRQGIGSALYQTFLEAIAPYSPPSVQTWALEDSTETLHFLAQRGFVELSRSRRSQLALTDFHPEEFSNAEKPLPEQGIVIQTLSQIDSDTETRRRLYETMNTLWEDVPSSNPYSPPSFDRWESGLLDKYLPDGFFIAVDEKSGEYVGISTLSRVPGSDHLDTYLTGVRRDYRRRGIALALKVRAANYALSIGVPVIRTANAVTNTAMWAINEKLGFREQPTRIIFVCHF